MRELPDEEFLRQITPWLPAGVSPADLRWTVGSLKERTKRYAEVPAELEWLTDDTPPSAAQLSAKGLDPALVGPVLTATADALEGLPEFEPAHIEPLLDRVREERDLNRRRMFMTLRVALAGRPGRRRCTRRSPPSVGSARYIGCGGPPRSPRADRHRLIRSCWTASRCSTPASVSLWRPARPVDVWGGSGASPS